MDGGCDTVYQGLIITKDKQILEECCKTIDELGDIKTDYIQSINELEDDNNLINYLFVILSDLEQEVLNRIMEVQLKVPGLSTVFYNHSLNYVEYPFITGSSNIKMIIGENRESNLAKLLKNIKNNFWRRIPYNKMGIKYNDLSARMKDVIQYIETAPISECNINAISSHLNISSGYFSQEFKREIKRSFRTFMQDVIDYYENVIFSQVNLPAKNISRLLGYSELSSFSRSFKKRKGVSPTKYKKIVNS